ncbi:hypothetical protein DVH05_017714 [Phytophthora capsici]|nr:hypothetical protein DVH05_017714 [Phytophthora capsici]
MVSRSSTLEASPSPSAAVVPPAPSSAGGAAHTGAAPPAAPFRATIVPVATSSAVLAASSSSGDADATTPASSGPVASPAAVLVPTTDHASADSAAPRPTSPPASPQTPAPFDVIVVDADAEPSPSPAPSSGRASARLRERKKARSVRPAARTARRAGPSGLDEPRSKKRKSTGAQAASATAAPPRSGDAVPRPILAASASTNTAPPANCDTDSVPAATTATEPLPPPCTPVSSLTTVPSNPVVTHEQVARPIGAAERVSEPSVATTVSSEATAAALAPTVSTPPTAFPLHGRISNDFNLEEFAQSFQPGHPRTNASVPPHAAALSDKVDQLFDMFADLQRQLRSQSGAPPQPVAPPAVPVRGPCATSNTSVTAASPAPASGTSWTLPPAGSATDLPPAAISELRCDSFPVIRSRVKGEYYPPLAHQLAAHRMFRDLNTETGTWLSPMSFVLHLRELECVRFDAPPAVLMALYSGRLGSRGLTVMHFRPLSELELLERGSTNGNFSSDFGASASLPVTAVDCASYEDPLSAISGLISFGDALWFDHVRRLLSRTKRFVLANMERDNNSPERVRLTLMYVNQFLGRALAYLLVDSPHWWRGFCDAVRAIDYHSADWQAALNGLALRMATSSFTAPGVQPKPSARPQAAAPRRGPSTRTPIMPDHIRRLIPRDRDGREPCLRFLAGGMCYGGSPVRCAHNRRTHHWDGRLPRELQDFVDRNYGAGRRRQELD